MEKILITEENRIQYLEMVPAEYLHLLYRPDYLSVGGYEIEGDRAYPVAVMILSANDEEVIINWLYVPDEERGKGFGDEMLEYAFALARNNKLSTVTAVVQRTDVHNEPGDPVDYFLSCGFGIDGYTENAWMLTAEDISNKLKPIVKDLSKVSSLSGLPGHVLNARLNEIVERIGEESISGIDREVSCAYMEGSEVLASVIVSNTGGVYTMVDIRFENGTAACLPALLLYVSKMMEEKNRKRSYLYTVFADEWQEAVAADIFNGIEPLHYDIMKASVHVAALEEDSFNEWLKERERRDAEIASFPEVAEIVETEYFSGIETEV